MGRGISATGLERRILLDVEEETEEREEAVEGD